MKIAQEPKSSISVNDMAAGAGGAAAALEGVGTRAGSLGAPIALAAGAGVVAIKVYQGEGWLNSLKSGGKVAGCGFVGSLVGTVAGLGTGPAGIVVGPVVGGLVGYGCNRLVDSFEP
jgi:hypothetical protein